MKVVAFDVQKEVSGVPLFCLSSSTHKAFLSDLTCKCETSKIHQCHMLSGQHKGQYESDLLNCSHLWNYWQIKEILSCVWIHLQTLQKMLYYDYFFNTILGRKVKCVHPAEERYTLFTLSYCGIEAYICRSESWLAGSEIWRQYPRIYSTNDSSEQSYENPSRFSQNFYWFSLHTKGRRIWRFFYIFLQESNKWIHIALP